MRHSDRRLAQPGHVAVLVCGIDSAHSPGAPAARLAGPALTSAPPAARRPCPPRAQRRLRAPPTAPRRGPWIRLPRQRVRRVPSPTPQRSPTSVTRARKGGAQFFAPLGKQLTIRGNYDDQRNRDRSSLNATPEPRITETCRNGRYFVAPSTCQMTCSRHSVTFHFVISFVSCTEMKHPIALSATRNKGVGRDFETTRTHGHHLP